MKKRKLILYIASSLDGYIAAPHDDLSFLNRVQKEGEDYGYAAFIASVDTVILGRKTYDWVIKEVGTFPHADKETYVITHTPQPMQGNTQFYNGDLTTLITELKEKDGQHIFCDGGAIIVNELLRRQLFDELIISVVPVLIGNGTRLFQDDRPLQDITLVSAKQFETGLLQLHYRMSKDI